MEEEVPAVAAVEAAAEVERTRAAEGMQQQRPLIFQQRPSEAINKRDGRTKTTVSSPSAFLRSPLYAKNQSSK
jgi:hypothetical protein